MNRSKNDHIIEMAKKFIDNCNSFEIKDLDADNQYLNNLPAITPFTDRIKEYLNPFEEMYALSDFLIMVFVMVSEAVT